MKGCNLDRARNSGAAHLDQTGADIRMTVLNHLEGKVCALTTFRGFVGAIGAVHVQVAHKVLRNTLPVLAHELILWITSAVGVH